VAAFPADPDERAKLFAEAQAAWSELDRPLDAERAASLAERVSAQAARGPSRVGLGGGNGRWAATERRLSQPTPDKLDARSARPR
jgi:hypothetical protein